MLSPIALALAAALAQDPAPDPGRFTTDRPGARELPLPAEDPAFTFAIFGDRTGGPAAGVEVLREAVDEVNLLQPDLVMTVGDLIQGYNQRDAWLAQMREFRAIMDGLAMPWFPVAGNHDVYWRGPAGEKPEGEHEAAYEEHFGPLWYAFRHKDAWFLVLYTDEGDPATGKRDFNRPECQRMSPAQLAWLDATLAHTREAEHVFVFLHHPRWLGGKYGDDWGQVHERLVAAGNVSAVFAGHIHHMRYDGARDGIEYFTLATVGGHQAGHAPAAGWLHQYHLVTVREDRVALAAYPVGSAMDPRAITGEVAEETAKLARELRVTFGSALALGPTGGARQALEVTVHNPIARPIEVTLTPTSRDSRWVVGPDHDHGVVEASASRTFTFLVGRAPGGLDAHLEPLALELAVEYLGADLRVPLPVREVTPGFDLAGIDLPPESPTGPGRSLQLDGIDDHLRIESAMVDLPDGPLTLEAWFRAERFDERQGLVNKTENSEYGLFVGEGRPQAYLHLGGRYLSVEPPPGEAPLVAGRWHHLAMVHDGVELRLYLDGSLVGSTAGSGPRTRNELPLLVGADVAGGGRATSFFPGRIDEVRLSKVARYAGEAFEPARRFDHDADTVLLLHLDDPLGPWAPDRGTARAHGLLLGGAALTTDG